MNSIQTEHGTKPEDDALRQASVRELIVQLELVEDGHRNAADSQRIAALARGEQVIVAALHEYGLVLRCSQIPKPPKQGTVRCLV